MKGVRVIVGVLAVFLSCEAEEIWSGRGLMLREEGTVPILFVSGTPEEMGRQHGTLAAEEVRQSYQRVLLVAGGYLYLKDDWFFDRIQEVEKRTGNVLPARFLRECDAMSEAAGLTRKQGREINLFPEMFHCSGVALRGKATVGGKVVHARVLDYMRDIGLERSALVQVFLPDGYHAWLSIGFAGFNGTVTAMNEKGLAMGEIGGRGEGKWDGLPMSFLMRRVMEECGTVQDAIRLIRSVPLTCGYYYVLSDAGGDLAALDAKAGEPLCVLRPGDAHPLLRETLEDGVYVTNPKRQETLLSRIRENYGRIDSKRMEEIIRQPVAMRSNLHNAIFEPQNLDVSFAYCDKSHTACDRPYRKLNLRDLLSGYRDKLSRRQPDEK